MVRGRFYNTTFSMPNRVLLAAAKLGFLVISLNNKRIKKEELSGSNPCLNFTKEVDYCKF